MREHEGAQGAVFVHVAIVGNTLCHALFEFPVQRLDRLGRTAGSKIAASHVPQFVPGHLLFASSQKGSKAKVVSNNPFASPIPLEALKSYSLAYSSPSKVQVSDSDSVPEVKVFQFSR